MQLNSGSRCSELAWLFNPDRSRLQKAAAACAVMIFNYKLFEERVFGLRISKKSIYVP
jgi:hypothetical protein